VGVVAIAAFNQPFIYPVMKRHVELGFLLEMACIAKLGLCLYQQELRFFGVVRRMAGNATHIIPGVLRVDDIHVLVAAGMARQAARINFFSGVVLENENLCLISTARNVICSRTVASFATLVGWTALGIERRLPMRSFLPIIVDILVAGLAGVGADII
jgi:hypothetical protein